MNYAQLVKLHGKDPADHEKRDSPATCIGADARRINGLPEPAMICTSHVEWTEPHHWDGDAPVHPAHKCLQP